MREFAICFMIFGSLYFVYSSLKSIYEINKNEKNIKVGLFVMLANGITGTTAVFFIIKAIEEIIKN